MDALAFISAQTVTNIINLLALLVTIAIARVGWQMKEIINKETEFLKAGLETQRYIAVKCV